MRSPRFALRAAILAVAAATLAPLAAPAADSGAYIAADPGAAAVTEKSLLASERFWPYQVALTSPWQAKGQSAPFRAGTLGVLVRVEPGGKARIDLGSEGRFLVPVGKTDLLQRANAVRTGALAKPSPNLAHAIGTRLVDSESEKIGYFDPLAVSSASGFLAVFVDPGSPDLAAMAAALAPLRARHGVMTVLFPQGDHPDPGVREHLRSLDWRVPFLLDGFGEGYARSLRGDAAPLPAVMLLSREGRVILDRAWKDGVDGEIAAELERAFGAGASAATLKSDARP